MATDKLDKLFRQKSENYRAAPTENAWHQISDKLNTQKNFYPWIRIAAILIIGIGIAWYMNPFKPIEESPSNPMIIADHPRYEPLPTPKWNIPPDVTETESNTGKNVIKALQEEAIDKEKSFPEPVFPESLKTAKVDYTTPDLPPVILEFHEKEDGVVIKYYADATDQTDQASSSKIKQLITYASNKTPAEILGDIREVKNEFINSKLNID